MNARIEIARPVPGVLDADSAENAPDDAHAQHPVASGHLRAWLGAATETRPQVMLEAR